MNLIEFALGTKIWYRELHGEVRFVRVGHGGLRLGMPKLGKASQ